MKLSILYLVNVPSPYRVSFFNELGKYCDLTVIFDKYQSSVREKKWHDYNFDTFKGVFLNNNDENNLFKKSKVIKYLDDEKYDAIVVGNYSTPAGMFSIGYLNHKKIPFVISVDGGLINSGENKIKRKLKSKLISSASAWLSTGESTNKYLTYYGAKKEHIYIYPFTTMRQKDVIDEPLTSNEKKEIRKELKIPYENVIISVGRFIPLKGFDVLIKAAKEIDGDTGIYIIGGKPSDEYIELIKQNNINNVHFIDFLEYSKLKKYYLGANLFVFPTREDVWGLVINEAMANALPVITTTSCVAGLEMIEPGKNGFLVSKNNVNELAKKTSYILANDYLQYEMSANNLKRAHEYTIENMAEITFNILSELKNNLLKK